MTTKKYLDEQIGRFRILLESIEGPAQLHDYGIPRAAWLRAIKLMGRYGPDEALGLIDQRAEAAAERRDFETARRWRELITAIHAMQEDELLPGDRKH